MRRPLLLGLLVLSARAQDVSSGYDSANIWPGRDAFTEEALRSALLSGRDSKVPPSTNAFGKGAVQISVQYRIFKVISLDISTGQLILKVWRRMVWWDDRLVWDPSEHGGLQDFRVYPNTGGLDDNMWRPPVVLYNAITPESQTLDVGAAWMRSDGRVWWSVPGTPST